MVKTREDYEPEVTGFLDDVDGAIVDAYFEPNPRPEYQQKAGMGPGLTIIVDTPSLDRPYEQWYSVGPEDHWKIGKDGQEVVNIKKPDKHQFNKQSRAWDFVDAVVATLGEGDMAKGQDVLIKRDKFMTEAPLYVGLNFHWRRKPLPTVGGGTTEVPLPVTYLGEVAPGKRESPKAATAVRADTSEIDNVIAEMASGKTVTELKKAVMVAKREGKFGDKPFVPDDAYIRDLISGKRLEELENEAKIVKDAEGKYI